MNPLRCLWLLLTILVVPLAASATSMLLLDDAEQAQMSDGVVLARVIAQRVERSSKLARTMTISTLAVDEVLYGESPKTVLVHQLKGTLNGLTQALPGSAELRVGERVVMFLHQVDDIWYPTALEQSKYSVKVGRLGDLLVRPPLQSALFERSPDGRLVAVEEPPRKPTYRLDELRRKLAALKGPG